MSNNFHCILNTVVIRCKSDHIFGHVTVNLQCEDETYRQKANMQGEENIASGQVPNGFIDEDFQFLVRQAILWDFKSYANIQCMSKLHEEEMLN